MNIPTRFHTIIGLTLFISTTVVWVVLSHYDFGQTASDITESTEPTLQQTTKIQKAYLPTVANNPIATTRDQLTALDENTASSNNEIISVQTGNQLNRTPSDDETSAHTIARPELNMLLDLASLAMRNGDLAQVQAYQDQIVKIALDSPTALLSLVQLFARPAEAMDQSVVLATLMDAAAVTSHERVQHYALKILESGSPGQSQKMYSLLAAVGVRSEELRGSLLATLPQMTNHSHISATIRAIVPQPDSTDNPQFTVSTIEPFIHHENDEVRSEAIRSVALWDNSGKQTGIVETALLDPSEAVRHAAAATALMSSIRSNSIKLSLLEILDNPDESYFLKEQAYSALGEYTLNNTELTTYTKFKDP